jgi:hypothetical protein
LDDIWEQSVGAKVGKADAWQDSDKDGVLNFDAFLDHLERKLLR